MTYTVEIYMTHGLQILTLTDCSQEAAEEFKETKVGTQGFVRIPMDDGHYHNIAALYIAYIRIIPNK